MGEGKFGFNPLLSTCLRPSNQQLMTEAPIYTADVEDTRLETRVKPFD
jgi:hypothetical protein